MKIPDKIRNCFEDYEYYKINNLSLTAFLERDFIEAFIKKGQIFMLSGDVNVEVHNCLALLPTGKLILNITKDFYEELGLEGKSSPFLDMQKKKFVVEVDLVSSSFVPGKKLFERTVQCFSRCSNILFNCFICWIPPKDNICPSSVAAYFHNKGLDIKNCQISSSNFLLYSTLMPVINSVEWNGSEEFADYKDFIEWIGGITCHIDWNTPKEEFLSTYKIPEANTIASQVAIYQWRGFIPTFHPKLIFTEMQHFVKENSSPWVALIIHGFQDCPIPSGTAEHKFHNNNDDSLIFILFPNGNYWKYCLL